jgi:hypothetical protein
MRDVGGMGFLCRLMICLSASLSMVGCATNSTRAECEAERADIQGQAHAPDDGLVVIVVTRDEGSARYELRRILEGGRRSIDAAGSMALHEDGGAEDVIRPAGLQRPSIPMGQSILVTYARSDAQNQLILSNYRICNE